jgi:hypothetical protein
MLILPGAALFAWPVTALACPNCVDSIAAGGSIGEPGTSGSMAGGIEGSMAAGYYYSILFMLFMLFSVTGGIAYAIWRQARSDAQRVCDHPAPIPDDTGA